MIYSAQVAGKEMANRGRQEGRQGDTQASRVDLRIRTRGKIAGGGGRAMRKVNKRQKRGETHFLGFLFQRKKEMFDRYEMAFFLSFFLVRCKSCSLVACTVSSTQTFAHLDSDLLEWASWPLFFRLLRLHQVPVRACLPSAIQSRMESQIWRGLGSIKSFLVRVELTRGSIHPALLFLTQPCPALFTNQLGGKTRQHFNLQLQAWP